MLIHYYPNLVRRIIVLEMPWVMNTVWRLVKSLLPGPAQDMIKFCTKVRNQQMKSGQKLLPVFKVMSTFLSQANVTEFLDTEGLPRELGGEDDWQYSWQVSSQNRLQRKIKPRYIVLLSRNSAISRR